jgi:hypothetical protein
LTKSDVAMWQAIMFAAAVVIALGGYYTAVAVAGRCRHPVNSRRTIVDYTGAVLGWRCADRGRSRVRG